MLVDKYMMGKELEVDVISDGDDILIPGIMEHIERAGVHSGDSIAVYPPYNLSDKMRETIVDVSEKLALSLGTKGLVNIQYLFYQNELYVIEVNPRASRTIPYISKVTNVPMVDLATNGCPQLYKALQMNINIFCIVIVFCHFFQCQPQCLQRANRANLGHVIR